MSGYRAGHLLSNLGWVDFDLECSIILPTCSATSANFPSAQAELGKRWNRRNQSQPNLGSPGDALYSRPRRCSSATLHRDNRHKFSTCKVCGEKVLSYRMSAHLISKHRGDPIPCPTCGAKFADEKNLTRHNNTGSQFNRHFEAKAIFWDTFLGDLCW